MLRLAKWLIDFVMPRFWSLDTLRLCLTAVSLKTTPGVAQNVTLTPVLGSFLQNSDGPTAVELTYYVCSAGSTRALTDLHLVPLVNTAVKAKMPGVLVFGTSIAPRARTHRQSATRATHDTPTSIS